MKVITVDRLKQAVDKLKSREYTCSLGTTWTATGAYFTQNVIVTGITATDTPIVDLVASTSDYNTAQKEWGKVFKITTSANTLTFYATEATTVALSIKLKVV